MKIAVGFMRLLFSNGFIAYERTEKYKILEQSKVAQNQTWEFLMANNIAVKKVSVGSTLKVLRDLNSRALLKNYILNFKLLINNEQVKGIIPDVYRYELSLMKE